MSDQRLKDLPVDRLRRFLLQHMSRKIICAAVGGAHMSGYAASETPLEIKGIHVEPTENLVGLSMAPKSVNWVGEFEGLRIDFSSSEIGQVCALLLRGDGSILERCVNPLQLIDGEDLRRLDRVARGAICRRFYNYYGEFHRGIVRGHESNPTPSVRRVLHAYRIGLTGIHLMRTGAVELDLMTLARSYDQARLAELVTCARADAGAVIEEDSSWLTHMIKLHAQLEQACNESSLPADPPDAAAVEEYLLDMRRRFFDAHTVQQ